MLQRIIAWFRSDVWRMATIGLALILVVVVLIFSLDNAALDSAADPETDPSPTATIPDDGSSGTTSGTGEATSVGPQVSDTGNFLAIKVDNAPGARPQVGIGSTTLLIEMPVEGGLTRFLAIYPRDGSGVVGPVRSLRPVDVDLLPPLAVHVVSTGGQPFILEAVALAVFSTSGLECSSFSCPAAGKSPTTPFSISTC